MGFKSWGWWLSFNFVVCVVMVFILKKNYTALETFLLEYSSKKFLKESTLQSPSWN
jgi:hypothetical protein